MTRLLFAITARIDLEWRLAYYGVCIVRGDRHIMIPLAAWPAYIGILRRARGSLPERRWVLCGDPKGGQS